MKIKGTAVKSTPQFVKDVHKDKYNKWLASLPQASKDIMQKSIDVTAWYPLTEAVIIPTENIAKLFFSDSKEAAFEVGKYSAEVALKGVYKVFMMIATPIFMISRAAKIFSTYYDPAEIKVVENKNNKALIQVRKFKEKDCLIAYRIAGWLVSALEMMHKKNVRYNIDCDFTLGVEKIDIELTWL